MAKSIHMDTPHRKISTKNRPQLQSTVYINLDTQAKGTLKEGLVGLLVPSKQASKVEPWPFFANPKGALRHFNL